MDSTEASTISLDPELVAGAIRAATQEVFATMLALETQVSDLHVEQHTSSATDGLVCLIGLAGKWAGTGMISCSAPLACKLSSHLLMTGPGGDKDAVDEEVLDAMAEIANMIFGNVKNFMEEQLGAMGLSIPTVIYGRNFITRSMGEGQWTVIQFGCCGESMEVRLRLAPCREPQPVRHGFPSPQAMRL